MKKSTYLLNYALLLFAMMFVLPSASAVNSHLKKAPATDEFTVLSNLSAEEFLDLNAKDLKKITGKKLRFRDRMALKLAQQNVKKLMKEGASIDTAAEYKKARGGFNILGFLLGFVLGPIGVLLAWIFVDAGLRSSLIGLLCWIAIVAVWRLGR